MAARCAAATAELLMALLLLLLLLLQELVSLMDAPSSGPAGQQEGGPQGQSCDTAKLGRDLVAARQVAMQMAAHAKTCEALLRAPQVGGGEGCSRVCRIQAEHVRHIVHC